MIYLFWPQIIREKSYLWTVIQLGKTLISEDLLDKDFVCNIQQCKGACCVKGEAGAPLEEAELAEIDKHFDAIKPYLNAKGLAEIEKQGRYVKGWDGEWETPIIEGKECVYTLFDAQGKASCGIEKAYLDGKIDWKNPFLAIFILFVCNSILNFLRWIITSGKFVIQPVLWEKN